MSMKQRHINSIMKSVDEINDGKAPSLPLLNIKNLISKHADDDELVWLYDAFKIHDDPSVKGVIKMEWNQRQKGVK